MTEVNMSLSDWSTFKLLASGDSYSTWKRRNRKNHSVHTAAKYILDYIGTGRGMYKSWAYRLQDELNSVANGADVRVIHKVITISTVNWSNHEEVTMDTLPPKLGVQKKVEVRHERD